MTAKRWLWIGVFCACVAVALVFLPHSGEEELPERAASQRASQALPDAPPATPGAGAPVRESWGLTPEEKAEVEAATRAETPQPELAAAERRSAQSARDRRPASRRRPSAAPPRELTPAREAELEQELRFTEDALETSRDRAEEAIGQADARAPAPPPPVSAEAAAKAASVRFACGGEGSSCSSSANCCAGLACAGGVPGFGARGRCEAPR
jgi:hypothetical protein